MRRLTVLVALTACKASLGEGGGDASTDTASPDAVDALVLGPWSAPTAIDITAVGDDDPSATGDLLELYFNRAQDIYVTKRASTADPWGAPAAVTELNSTANDTTPEVSYDGLTIYFASARVEAGTLGLNDIWMSTRASRAAAWGTPALIDELSSTAADGAATPINDSLLISLDSDRAGTLDIYFSGRGTATSAWGAPSPAPDLNTMQSEGNPMLAADKLSIYFDSNRTMNGEVYVAMRASVTGSWGLPTRIDELASTGNDVDPWISPDGRTMYFTSDRDGTQRLWQTTR